MKGYDHQTDRTTAMMLAAKGLSAARVAVALGLDVDQVRRWLEPPATRSKLEFFAGDDDRLPPEAA